MKWIHLISGPRNISTALMYSFAQRSDTVVYDEPFYACYLSTTNVDHPGKSEVVESQSVDEREVTTKLFSKHEKPVVFIKNMAHHIEELSDHDFLTRCTSIFLIRDPRQLIASYAKVIEYPALRDIGIQYEVELFQHLKNKQQHPIVLDSGILLKDPATVLRKVCDACEIPFQRAMLQWQAGPKPYDGVWAPYWYANVHQSTGFERQPTSNRPLPVHLQALYEEASFYYNQLIPYAITP